MARVRYSFSSRRTGHIKNIKKQKEKFPKLIRDIVDIADIILEVLDARFISETRNFGIEKLIKEQGKQIIFVINKSDLIDIKKVKKQLKEQNLYPFALISSKTRRGSRELREKIKIEVKKLGNDSEETFEKTQVGVIGYPNTGKSSLINVLTGKGAAGVGSESGFTKGIQKISMAKNILILDTPGVIPEEEYSHTNPRALQKQSKLGARTIDKIKDPELIVAGLMKEYSSQIEKHYKIKADGDSEVLIEELGKKRAFLKKGGVVDEDRTSRLIIKEWQEGKIRI